LFNICPEWKEVKLNETTKKFPPNSISLENKSGTLGLLVTTKLEVFASFQGQLSFGLALSALQSQDNLLCGLSLLVEDRLGLTSVTRLLAVITTLSLSEQRSFPSLVLGDLVLGVLLARLALAVGLTGFRDVDHFDL